MTDLLLDRLAKNVANSPSKRAVAFLSPGPGGGTIQKELTYQALSAETSAVAQLLLKAGIQHGDRVVLVYPPSLDFMVAFLACLKAGIVAVPVFPPNPLRRDTLQMFAKIVQGCGAKVALTNSEYNHMKKISGIRDTFAKTFKSKNATISWPEDLNWILTDKNVPKPSKEPTFNSPPPSDVAFLQYTSGSTSDPKGVVICHGNLAHNLTTITKELKAGDDTVVVSWLPQYHDMGLIGSYLGALYCGGTGYYLSPLSFLQRPVLWIEAISVYKATHLQAPNFAFKLTARKFVETMDNDDVRLDLSSVRHVINAAEPVDEESIETFYKTFSPFGFPRGVIFPTYGLAEHTVFVCSGGKQRLTVLKKELEVDGVVRLLGQSDEVNATVELSGNGAVIAQNNDGTSTTRLVGCGYPKPELGVDVKIVSAETMEPMEEDMVGEIWVSSPSKAAGYYQMPEETKEDFHAHLFGMGDSGSGSDTYLRTGDLGFLHKGELFICGRLKDLIIVGGRNYYPQDLEATAESASELVRPGCSAAFTIDQTKEGGEEVALVMELKDVPSDKQTTESICLPLANTIRSAINKEHSLGLADIAFLQTRSVPKTSSGKIARSWCRKGFAAGTLKIVYRKSFKSSAKSSFEIESPNGAAAESVPKSAPVNVEEIRALSKEDILKRLETDISKLASIPPNDIQKNVALVAMLDSLTLTQFKGMLESNYATKLSGEYLFRESTTVNKLVEVVKLGYAPDDDEAGGAAGTGGVPASAVPGASTGLAGALGCPPGVVCVIL